MSKIAITEQMVGRFLSWPLPSDFAPDGGISFTRSPHVGMSPTGTNLLHFGQAKAMLEHCINGADANAGALSPHQQPALDACMTFGQAIEAAKSGQRIARTGWNGKGLFVYLVPAARYPAQTGAAKAHFGEGSLVPYNPYLAIKNVDETVSTWVPSVNDCLACDWCVIPQS